MAADPQRLRSESFEEGLGFEYGQLGNRRPNLPLISCWPNPMPQSSPHNAIVLAKHKRADWAENGRKILRLAEGNFAQTSLSLFIYTYICIWVEEKVATTFDLILIAVDCMLHTSQTRDCNRSLGVTLRGIPSKIY